MIYLVLVTFLKPHILDLSAHCILVGVIIVPHIRISVCLDSPEHIIEISVKLKILICKAQIERTAERRHRMSESYHILPFQCPCRRYFTPVGTFEHRKSSHRVKPQRHRSIKYVIRLPDLKIRYFGIFTRIKAVSVIQVDDLVAVICQREPQVQSAVFRIHYPGRYGSLYTGIAEDSYIAPHSHKAVGRRDRNIQKGVLRHPVVVSDIQ